MSIQIEKPTEDKRVVNLDNGHVQALKKITADYNLKGEEEALSFMLSILSEADGNAINNGKGSFVPSEKLKKTESNA